jgi:P-type Cu+ transporter
MTQQAPGRVTLAVSGMSCGGCAAGVQRILTQAPGVREAQVTFATGQATVEYDPAQTAPQALAALVIAAGYEVAPRS